MRFPLVPSLFLAGAALLGGCTQFNTEQDTTAAYSVNLTKGAAAEIDHPAYDPEIKGYWIVGSEGTLQFTRMNDASVPDSFCLMLRTKPDASEKKPSELDLFKILTFEYRIVTRFNPVSPAPVDVLTYKGDVLVKTDSTGKYVRFERVGERIKVTLTKECLTQLIGGDAAISWVDYPAAKKPTHSAAETEGYRRVL